MSCKLVCKCCTPKRRLCCWSTCGAISFILIICFALTLGLDLTDELFFLIIKKDLMLLPHSSILDDWADNRDVPSYKINYIFNTQNPDEFSQGAIPIVKEVGPFTYREYDKKMNLKWNGDESLISYNQNKYYVFVPEKSVGDPHDYNITVLNFPLLIVLNMQQEVENLLFRILRFSLAEFYIRLIGDQSLFVNKTAQEIIWGYDDPILRMLELIGLIDTSIMTSQSNTTDLSLIYTVNTGKNDIDCVDNLVRWRNLTKIAEWNSEDSRSLYGSFNGHFHPRIKKHESLTMFLEQVFRHAEVVYKCQASLHGIDLYRYESAHHVFSNSSEYPPNVGYYAYSYDYGLMNISAVHANIPFFFSQPHCFGCSPEYFKNVSGYHPDKSKHVNYGKIEPFTGITMELGLRGQRNIKIERSAIAWQLSSVPDVTFYPWFYTSQEATITKDKADDFKRSVQLPRTILKVTVIIFLCISGMTGLCAVGVLLRLCYKSRWVDVTSRESLQNNSDDSSSPISINHSDPSSPLLPDNSRTKDYHAITQSTV